MFEAAEITASGTRGNTPAGLPNPIRPGAAGGLGAQVADQNVDLNLK
jgi:hypothetical protein